MTLQAVQDDLARRAPDLEVMVTDAPTATVQQAADVHQCVPGQIAKTLCLRVGERAILVVASGDARLDNKKTKAEFGTRPRMLGGEDVEALTGHAIGGVCPFGLPNDVPIYLDMSLKRFDMVIPAAGAGNASVSLTLDRLEALTGGQWIACCSLPEGDGA